MGIFKLNGIDYMGGGGGGNTNYEELTQLEYDALTEEEKNNGTIYFITDTNSNQDGKFQPVIYSEEEREVGVWTDGKPLYKRTLVYEKSDISSGNNTITHGISNIGISAWLEGLVIYIDDTCVTLPAVGANNDWSARAYDFGTTTFALTIGSGMYNQLKTSGDTIFITVYYTKTTDSPGSGQWTPQGIPAVHYSTDEQIVGTWIDGSTLYEKTISFTTSATAGAYIQIPHGISNVDKLWVDTGNSFVIGATYTTFAVGYGVNNAQGGSLFQVLVTNERLDYIVGSAHTSCPAYVTLRYTKTTS